MNNNTHNLVSISCATYSNKIPEIDNIEKIITKLEITRSIQLII